MKQLIRGKVARVLNSREVALNIGTDAGVEIGMYFDIMDQCEENVVDPDTAEVLGTIERSKVRVKVVKVQPKLSVASTYRIKKINIGGRGVFGGGVFADSLRAPEWVDKHETLKTDEKTWEDISESESFVKTGDPVVEHTESSERILAEF